MNSLKELLKKCVEINCSVVENEPMDRHTSFKIGGPADLFITPSGTEALQALMTFSHEREIPFRVIGNGSNLLVSDEGIRGAVFYMGSDMAAIRLLPDSRIECGAGISLKKLCVFACDNAMTGLEFAYGIPGNAGGAAFMNAGAYGGEMKDVLVACRHITREGLEGELAGEDLKLSYRSSAYTLNGYAVTSLLLRLQPGDSEEIKAKMEDIMFRRKSKQPLEFPSAGSVFKRPPGYFAGGLIENCGLKGKTVGGAQVSEKHAGFIINRGSATCKDVLTLIELVKNEVYKQYGVVLEPEIKAI